MVDAASSLGGGGSGGAQAIRRAMAVVRVVAQMQRSGATASGVARALGLSRPTAFRILRTLVDERMLQRGERDRTYRIGPLAYEIGLAAPYAAQGHSRWGAVVDAVAHRTRLTSYLIGRSGDEAVCLLCVQGATTIRAVPMEVGQRVPLGIGAGSLAILADLPDADMRRVAAAHGHRLGRDDGEAVLLERVACTVRHGFSISSGTVAAGTSGVGVILSVSDPAARLAVTVSAVTPHLSDREAASLASAIERCVNAL